MGIILVGGLKGGTGKSTVATNLAAMRAVKGRRVILGDADGKQQSASRWLEVRTSEGVEPHITRTGLEGKCGASLLEFRKSFDDVIVDCGGYDSQEFRQSMAVCDMMIVPVQPSQFDSWTIDQLASEMNAVMERIARPIVARIVFNQVSPNPRSREADETREFLETHKDILPVLPSAMVTRVAFREAARAGRGVIELNSKTDKSAALTELQALYAEVFHD